MDHVPCGPLTEFGDVLQYFRLDYAELTGIQISIATHFKIVTRCLEISLHGVPSEIPNEDLDYNLFSRMNQRLGPIASTSKSLWSDHDSMILPVDPKRVRKGARYALHIKANKAPGSPELVTWLHAAGRRIEGHISTFYGGEHQGHLGLEAELQAANPIVDSHVPTAILYSPVTQCNLNCIHCISRETRNSKNILCSSIKARIKEWCDQGLVTQLATDYSGDILWADKRFGGEIEFLKSLDIPFHIDTNGVHLDEAVSERLLESRLKSLNVSLDAATTGTFQRVRKGAPPLEDVASNIEKFVKLQSAAGAQDRIVVSMSFTLMRSTLHELREFVLLAARLGVRLVHARHLEAYTEDMGPESLIFDHKALTKALVEAVKLGEEHGVTVATYNLPGSYGSTGHGKCDVSSGSAVILGNGDVAVCCVPKMTIGNLHDNTMEEIWNGRHYQEFRRRVNSEAPPPQCASCPMIRRTNNVHSYLPFLTINDWQHPKDWRL